MASPGMESFESEVRPFIQKYCHDCHGGKKVKGKVDFTKISTSSDLDESFELWETVMELLKDGEMPPDAAKQPFAGELEPIFNWYQKRFVDSVDPHPGFFKPRRLSAHEYRNTLRSLLGFDLEVAVMEAEQTRSEKSLILKLLPVDPPGKSGFQNDTSGNPLTANVWDQYSYLLDTALEELFSPKRRRELETLCGQPIKDQFQEDHARDLLNNLVPRILRRAPDTDHLQAILDHVAAAPDVEEATRFQIKSLLLSPAFLYRGLVAEGKPGKVTTVDAYELAERLSYFLWADMPDEALMQRARSGQLVDPVVLAEEVDRMIASPKSRNLAEDFAVQWLALNEIDQFEARQLPLAESLKSEPIEFFDYLIRENRPLMELIDSKVTFISQHTGKYYPGDRKQLKPLKRQKGIEMFHAPMERIRIEESPGRGGLLTMPGILAMNKGPVLRGTWMLERILGEHLPEPPANVGQVPQNRKGQNLTFRQLFEKHRSNSTCAVCHNKIDPLGFALQAYDKNGEYVLAKGYKPSKGVDPDDVSPERIDTRGRLPGGETFADFDELKHILMSSQKEQIIRNLVERMLSYALARKLEIHDQPTVKNLTEKLARQDGTYHDLIHAITQSLPFRYTEFPEPQTQSKP